MITAFPLPSISGCLLAPPWPSESWCKEIQTLSTWCETFCRILKIVLSIYACNCPMVFSFNIFYVLQVCVCVCVCVNMWYWAYSLILFKGITIPTVCRFILIIRTSSIIALQMMKFLLNHSLAIPIAQLFYLSDDGNVMAAPSWSRRLE